jgi:hypothetical protein
MSAARAVPPLQLQITAAGLRITAAGLRLFGTGVPLLLRATIDSTTFISSSQQLRQEMRSEARGIRTRRSISDFYFLLGGDRGHLNAVSNPDSRDATGLVSTLP